MCPCQSLSGAVKLEGELFFIQRADKSALVDPSYKRWIDDETRIGLFCLRVVSGDHVQRIGNHLIEGVGTASSPTLVCW